MSQVSDIAIVEPAVLGVSVLGEDIATVVRDATGEIVASNHVELADGSADGAFTAFVELVDSAPFTISQIALACASRDVAETFGIGLTGPAAPSWAGSVTSVSMAAALAQAARREADGEVAVVALDRSGAPVVGESLAVVDASHAVALGSAEVAAAQSLPVTDPAGAQSLRAVLDAAGGYSPTSVMCVGAGAALPGITEAVSAATGRPSRIVPAPVFAIAQGATAVMSSETRRIPTFAPTVAPVGAYTAQTVPAAAAETRASSLRWWAIGGAIGAAALVCLVTLVALFTGDGAAVPAATPSTVTVPGTSTEVTVTERGQVATETVLDEHTVTTTVTTTAAPQTRTATATETVTATETQTAAATETVTVTEQATVTETVTETAEAAEGPFGG